MRVRVLWFGRRGTDAVDELVEDYRRRVERRWPAEDRALRPAAGGRDGDPRRALRHESRAVDRALDPSRVLVALDERGRRFTSEAFAAQLGDWEDRSTPGVDLVIGSDLGLDPEIVARSGLRLSLGPMTLPHRLARLVVWEQLFRATTILGGGGYHRRNVQYQ